MALLTGDLAKQIYAGFKGKLLKGTLTRHARDKTVGLDDLGDPRDRKKTEYKVEGFVDSYSRSAKGRDGIPETDLRVNIFAGSLPAGVKPAMDDQVVFIGRADTFLLRDRIETDPAEALWQCQATPIKPKANVC